MAGADEGDPHGGSSVTGETYSSVDNTSQASVTMLEMTEAGYQQDPARPELPSVAGGGMPPLSKALFQAKPFQAKSSCLKSRLVKASCKKASWQTSLGKQKDRPETVFVSL
jgi:hypothetical protein